MSLMGFKEINMNRKYMSDTYFIGALLAVVGGYLDAYTYIARGGVFANAQTGNIVLFGLSLARGSVKAACYYLVPIFAFALGIVAAEGVRNKYKEKSVIHWRQITLFIEVMGLLAAAFMHSDMLANILVSFVCSVQVQSFRKVNGNTLATTMCTGNLRTGTEALFYGIGNRDKEKLGKGIQYYGIILFFIIGAGIGTVITNAAGTLSVLCPCVLLVLCLLLLWVDKEM